MRLRTFLLAVVTLTLVPLLGVAGIAIWWAHQDERRAMQAQFDALASWVKSHRPGPRVAERPGISVSYRDGDGRSGTPTRPTDAASRLSKRRITCWTWCPRGATSRDSPARWSGCSATTPPSRS